ncbi:Sigma-37 [uncultured Clostridium sp.]|uniref:SigB/SigF/SigG family RNA polymerase sigma factor n=1 Tax=Paeniclostridium hominis TaxID=2764329 RepID=A0ABR7K6H4_9FIRM|nr:MULTISPECIES: SigB/SigF/SigG family RNA polymerase sigma factor [Paeniclostridium]MBC6004626.1 SigB/SigF/SigG family RNA polymerase sigma factor [Paeniclostridium hominis]MDU2592099.1 SigB/SigF/SigG family RNA polymerase sigma factor [Paeniclostridium sordellii]SCJ39476.1 Sigma-37 [uncultured Clostridium sp.]SCJ41713.1 Sigma-37 [uncultured Clostridium sp.]
MRNVANATSYMDMTTKELFNIYSKDKNVEIRNILIERHMYLANILSKKYINKGVEFDDIYQVASLALIYAIDRYDIEKGYEFSSFATPTIIGEIKKYFRDKVWTVKVPRRIQELSKKISEAKLFLEQKNKRSPKAIDIANYLGCSEEEVLEAIEASYGYQPMSLDTSSNDDSDDKEITLKDKIGQEETSFGNIENMDFINKFIETLNELEVKIFKDRFFLDKTQSIIAKELEISQMTVSRLERKIIEKLKKEYEKNL